MEQAEKQMRLDQLALSWGGCVSCELSRSRQCVVFHRGNPNAAIAIVGDAPGRAEEARGVPFAGQAGKVIDALLIEAKVSFADVCFLNMIGCRTPGGRAPQRNELKACEPRTLDMLRTIDPAVVLMVGLVAARGLSEVTSIGPWRGTPVTVSLGACKTTRGVVTYHPAFLANATDSTKVHRQMLSDVKVARAIASQSRTLEEVL